MKLQDYKMVRCRDGATAEERFWCRVQKTDGCWIWMGAVQKLYPYGRFTTGKRSELAHRFSYRLHNGEFDDNLLVCHKCDNPRCVNPDHLFLGTHRDNFDDSDHKKRRNYHIYPDMPFLQRGESNVMAKLNAEKVSEIRKLWDAGETTAIQLGELFRVGSVTAWRIATRKRWKHIS